MNSDADLLLAARFAQTRGSADTADWDDVLRRARPRRHTHLRILLAAAAVVAAGVPTAVAFSGSLHSFVFGAPTPAQESKGLLDGSAIFRDTNPTCTEINQYEFHCTLKSVPTGEIIEGSYLGAKMDSVDSTKHVNGGCIATSGDGLEWDCYVGQAAVEHGVLSPEILGQYQREPSHG